MGKLSIAHLILFVTAVATGSPKKYVDKVLLVSMDGFRWDYLDKMNTPHFDYLADHGVKVKYVNNTFITETFPCHYSIATGLYEENHGIVANEMYDPVFDANFTMANHEPRWWEGGEPIWITATKQSVKSATYFWPGSEVAIHGVRPAIWKLYNQSVLFEKRIETVIDWFLNQDVKLATLYFHEPDHTGHVYGPYSDEMKAQVKYMDSVLGYMMVKLKAAGLFDSVNLILTSDHGMTTVDTTKRVNVRDWVNQTLIKMIPKEGPVIHIIPEDGEIDTVYQILEQQKQDMHMTVYKKEDIPEKFHYKDNRRIPPIIAMADEGWLLMKYSHYHPHGSHGYSNEYMSMKPIFLAHGPNFKENHRLTSIESVDIYPLICELLGINPAPNNGSLSNTMSMLKSDANIIG
ncbi:hypothetical protein LOTGIDRAFT_118461 [Lottia gigantea]|uniref:AP3A hydrolase n=1 Tax=Lottia gigantea TaxID=225164 RepID=V4AGH0_LOTGI|nr:hypothetical protein LOTGIDRAFT_118461 [Lottia gigantea]ESO94265.1 hypothetical protein LOTGIDRAFT_118461 [Lottia gigantea]